jgi:hypothetical protein
MIKVTTNKKSGKATITFSLPLDATPDAVSVAGDFNGWDPLADPLKKRTNGTRSAKVEVAVPARIEFKYLAEGGVWFGDPDADVEGDTQNCVLELTAS